MHQRNVIRNAIASVLTGSTDAGSRVFPTRKLLYSMRELPAIAIYSLTEDSDISSTAPRELTRETSFMIESIVAPGPNVDDVMDDLAEQIESAMDADMYFSGSCFDSELRKTDMDSAPDGDREIGMLEMTYLVKYRTDAFVETVSPDEFNTVKATFDLEGSQAELDQVSNTFTVQEEE